jgi:RHS repeat-associated protein
VSNAASTEVEAVVPYVTKYYYANGGEVGRVLYDPYGEVITSTLPITLTEQLLSAQGLDSQLGLVYHGDGRYYDPAIAHTLQPDPFGGVPQLPQTLNRYAITPVPALSAVEGGSVVGHMSPGLHPLLVTAMKGTGKTVLSTITGPARQRTLNVAIQSLLASTIGRSRPTGMTFVQLMGEPEAFTGAFANLKLLRSDTYPLPPQGCLRGFFRWLLRRPSTVQIETRAGLVASQALDDLPQNLGLIRSEPELVSPGWMTVAPKYIGTFIWGGELSGAVQYLSDYRNPYLTGSQIKWRTGIATAGGGTAAVVGAIAASKLGTALGIPGGPPTMIFGAGIGFTLGFIYFGYVQPQIFQGGDLNPQRKLAPLSSP